ncbi:carboxypeptidase-like regulatory domain-containing protein [Aquimarina sp. 2201CG1-2-11]|uniref:TonB-dependent receptor n=1 Tax=Aquimarina discodermiae TaxID=3231043 RepID=UPI0034621CA9
MNYKKHLFLIAFLSIFGIYAQQKKPLISLSFQNSDLLSVLDQIESKSKFRFYYEESWLKDYDNLSGNYSNISVEEVLKEVFKGTILNFYITDENTIILTQNAIVYDVLPNNYFGKYGNGDIKDIKKEVNVVVDPIFKRTRNSSSKDKKSIETISIGKATKTAIKEKFILTGKITNAVSGKAISGVLILVNGYDAGVRSDKNGYYQLELTKGANTIGYNALGMEHITKKILLYNDGNHDVILVEKIEQLREVVLQTKINKNVEETTTKTKIDVKESKNIPLALGERDVLKVATTLPGITTTGEGSSGYNVRGGKSDQNLILLDDAVIYNPQHFFGIFSALNPFVLGDVNIYKNGIPAEYGGRLSSVFDLSTKDANTDKFQGEVSIGPITGNVLLEAPLVKEKAGIMVGGRGAYANWVLKNLDEESLKNSEASFYDVVAKYNHQISENAKLEATAYMSRDDFSITSDSLFVYKNRAFSLRWNQRFDEKNTGKLVLSNSQYKFNIEYEGETNDNFEQGYSVDETELKLHFKYLYSDRLKFDYGVSSKYYVVKPGSIKPLGEESIIAPLSIDQEQALESAAFLTTKVDITKDFNMEVGLRYSVFNALGPSTQSVFREGEPKNETSVENTLTFKKNEVIKTYGGPELRVAGRYLIGEDFSVKAAYNKTYQFIHVLSNNTTVSPIDTWKLSDLNIKPQSSQQYSLGFYKNFNEATYEVSLEGFYKKTRDILDFKTGAQTLLNTNIENDVLQGTGKAYGVEVLLKKQKGKLYGWLGYTYARSLNKFDSEFVEEQVNGGEFFPSNFDKPHDFSAVLNYKFTKRFSLSSNLVYQTGRPVTFPVGNFTFNGADYTVYSERNKFRIPDYYRLDLGFNIEGNHKRKKAGHGFWTISVYNVLGRNNPLSVFFITEDGEVKGLQSSVFSVPVPSITYNFKF